MKAMVKIVKVNGKYMANKVIEKIKEIYKERNNKKKWYPLKWYLRNIHRDM